MQSLKTLSNAHCGPVPALLIHKVQGGTGQPISPAGSQQLQKMALETVALEECACLNPGRSSFYCDLLSTAWGPTLPSNQGEIQDVEQGN